MPSAVRSIPYTDAYALKRARQDVCYPSAGSLGTHIDYAHNYSSQSSPIQSLPTELLMYIFDLALPPLTDASLDDLDSDSDSGTTDIPFSAHTLSLVSRHWHTLVSSQPSLWTRTNLSSKGIYDNSRTLSHFIQRGHGHRQSQFALKVSDDVGGNLDSQFLTMGVLLAMGKPETVHLTFADQVSGRSSGPASIASETVMQAAQAFLPPSAQHPTSNPLLLQILPTQVPSLINITLDARSISPTFPISSNPDSEADSPPATPTYAHYSTHLISSSPDLLSLRLRGSTLHHFCIADLHLFSALRVPHLDMVHDLTELAIALEQTPSLEELVCGDMDLGGIVFDADGGLLLGHTTLDSGGLRTVLKSLRTLILDSEASGLLPAHIAFHTTFSTPGLTTLNLTAPITCDPRWTGSDHNSLFMRALLDRMGDEQVRVDEVVLDIAQEGVGE